MSHRPKFLGCSRDPGEQGEDRRPQDQGGGIRSQVQPPRQQRDLEALCGGVS